MDKIVAMIVDKKPSWRTNLRQTIAEGSSNQGIEVLECDPGIDGDEAVIQIDTLSPDVVLLDTSYPEQDGLKLCKRIVRSTPQTKVVMLTSNPTEDDDELFESIRSGASAFLLTEYCTPQEVWETIERASRAEYPINDCVSRKPQIASLLMRQFEDIICSVRKEDGIITPLNTKEVEVLKLIVQGKTNHEIGTVLQTSDSAVKKHVTSILRKLNANDRAEAVILALRGGLLSLQPKIGVSHGQDTISDEKSAGMAESGKMVEEGEKTESRMACEAEEIARQIIDEARQQGEEDAQSVIANAENQASQIIEESKRKAEAIVYSIIDEGRKVAQSAAAEATKQMIEDAQRKSMDNAGLIISEIIGEAEHQASQIIEDAKRNAQVDIDNIMEESRKAAQSASEEMRSQARVEASTITTEAEERAKQIIGDAINNGKSEASAIIVETHKKASQIIQEAGDTKSNILAEAEETAKRLIEDANHKAEANVQRAIADAEHQASQIIEDVKRNSNQETSQIIAVPESDGRTIPQNEQKSGIAEESEERGMAKFYDGIVELAVPPPVDLRALVALHKNLKNATDIDVLNVKGSIDKGIRIRMFLRKPMPLLGIVKGISKVVSISDDDGLTQSQEEEAVKRISVTFS
jgi:two-component system response regulator DegU